MRAFLGVVGFELRYYLGRISSAVYFLVLAGLGFLLVNLLGGAIEGANAAIGGSDGKVLINSPYVIAILTANVSLFGVLVTSALAGHAGYRDFGANMHPLVFTTPVSKTTLLAGRWTGSVLVNLVVLSGIGFGIWLGSVVPWVEADRFGDAQLGWYVAPYLTLVLPNLLFTAAIFFSLAALSRQRLPHYAAGVALLIGYVLASSIAGDVEDSTLAGLIDPFGFQALIQQTKYWTTVEKNALTAPLEGVLLWNRLLWIGAAAVVVTIATILFRFRQHGPSLPGLRRSGAPQPAAARATVPRQAALQLPAARRTHGPSAAWAQYLKSVRRAFSDVVGNAYFVVFLLLGLMLLLFGATQIGELYGTPTHAVTWQAIEVLGSLFSLVVLITITFYAGELAWQERDLKVAQVVDATPIAGFVPYLAKATALAAVVVALLVVLMAGGIVSQLARGFTDPDVGLYVRHLFGFVLVDYLLLAVLALAVQAVVNHKYVGHLVMVVFWGFTIFRQQMGLEHVLYGYGSDLGTPYSDMNEYGWFAGPWVWFKLYWGGVALVLAVLSNLFWTRGTESAASWRLKLAAMRLRSPAAAVGALGLVVAVSVGGFIFWNTNVLHDYRTSFEEEELLARYERDYSHLAELDPPRVQAVSLRVDLHPETGDLEVSGVQQLENTTAEPLERMLLRQPPDADVRRLEISRGASLGELDDDLGLRLVDFEPPLAPGERFDVSFDFAWTQRGFPAKGVNTRVVGNGSFVHSPDVLPGYGYQPAGELSTDRTREKHGLEPKERMRDLDDPEGRLENYISTDADWVDFEATVCTSPDQLAIAPGYLVREWEEDGRRCFHHEMDAPILHFFSFLSARYEVTEGRWRDVPIEVYHHPEHEYNVERMIDAAAKSLEYFSTNFSPYQHRQLRIIEFPRYATFAQAFPNTIPFSEGIGFIAKVGEEDIDYPFYVTSHEVAHQWWAHQVIGANVQGSTTLSETLSQYSALMVMEQEYGRARIGDFLRYELDQYLQGRAFETKKELPLLRVENQGYIHYRKGSLIFYRLKEMIGEDRLNAALASLLDEFAFEGPPYPTSRDLLRHLRDVTPEDMQYLLTDSFEHVTLHDLRAEEATWRKTEEGRYEVTLRFEGRKLRAGELGEETEVPLEDHVQVGAWGFEGDDDLVHVETVRLSPDQETLTFTLDEIPRRVGIDPLITLVDRHPDDNVVEARPAEGSPTS